jgi:NADH:ubiquinone oxidoreductase subunit 3 (subunit A)
MNETAKEKAKHAASFLSSVTNTLLNVGVFAPNFAYLFNLANFRNHVGLLTLTFTTLMVSLLCAGLFYFARNILNELSHDK